MYQVPYQSFLGVFELIIVQVKSIPTQILKIDTKTIDILDYKTDVTHDKYYNKYKTQISKIVYEQTGRELKLNGHAGIKISLIPTIELNDVMLSNADWAKEKEMIKVQNVDVSFSIIPLFKKLLILSSLLTLSKNIYPILFLFYYFDNLYYVYHYL